MSRKFLLATGAEFKLLTIWAEHWLAAEKNDSGLATQLRING